MSAIVPSTCLQSPHSARPSTPLDLSQGNRHRSHTVRRYSKPSSAPCGDASFSWRPTEATMREQRHRNTFNGHHEVSCARCDRSSACTSFDPSFALVIDPVLTARNDPLRRMPLIAHHTAFGTILVITSNIPVRTHSYGSFTRSVWSDPHPVWRRSIWASHYW